LTNNNFFIPQQLGMALVEGYDSMGFHMSKPYLRSELEADLKKLWLLPLLHFFHFHFLCRICEGTKNPQEVLQQQIACYKEVFQQAVAQVRNS
jgi:DNA topoisomerase III